jgi:hypothetical protein
MWPDITPDSLAFSNHGYDDQSRSAPSPRRHLATISMIASFSRPASAASSLRAQAIRQQSPAA